MKSSLEAPPPSAPAPDLLTWSERHRSFNGRPMRIPGPMRDIYRDTAPLVYVMKGAQLGLSEWIVNACLYVPDTAYAGRGTSFYVQPTGGSAGDFVQGRVRPAIDQSDYLTSRMAKVTGKASDPDKVGLMRIGRGYAYWRTARSKSGLKSVPADLLALDEYDEMPVGTLDLASHRLDSSAAPRVLIISTPTYPGAGIDVKYREGDQRVFVLRCPECGAEQDLQWAKNVERVEDEDGTARYERVCVRCRESLEETVGLAWYGREDAEGAQVFDVGEWRAQNSGAEAHSYHISQLYRPDADLGLMARSLAASDVTRQQEAWNQHLGLPFSPPGGQMSHEELTRISVAPFTFADIAGVQGCWMGIDVGTRLHVWLSHDSDRFGEPQRYLVGAMELDDFAEAADVMRRFGVVTCVVDAHPELRAVKAFQLQFPGRVYLCDYQLGIMPPAIVDVDEKDAQRRWRVKVDRTAAMDAMFAGLRGQEQPDGSRRFHTLLPADAGSVPGLFEMLQAPVRRLKPDKNGNPRGIYDEGSKPDHFAHAAVYAELAAFIGGRVIQNGTFDARQMSELGSWDRS